MRKNCPTNPLLYFMNRDLWPTFSLPYSCRRKNAGSEFSFDTYYKFSSLSHTPLAVVGRGQRSQPHQDLYVKVLSKFTTILEGRSIFPIFLFEAQNVWLADSVVYASTYINYRARIQTHRASVSWPHPWLLFCQYSINTTILNVDQWLWLLVWIPPEIRTLEKDFGAGSLFRSWSQEAGTSKWREERREEKPL